MRTAFKIPLQTEVQAYMKTKMGWPDKFCEYYAEKFWCAYQASGWKLSNGNAVKDWQACFNSQWKTLKFKEDIELLNSLTKTKVVQGSPGTDIEHLDALLIQYKTKFESVTREQFASWYDYLKANHMMAIFTKGDIELIREAYGNDKVKCRAACVQKTFDGYINSGLTFSDIIKTRERLK